jgi:hypothetical protein
MSKKIILHLIQGLLIALFLYTSIVKIADFTEFGSELKQSPILKSTAVWMAWLIPAVELTVVLLLLIPARRVQGFYASCLLLLAFSGYLVLLHYVNEYIPCDCGGFLEKMPPGIHISFNLLMAALALAGVWLEKRVKKSTISDLSLPKFRGAA